MKRTPDLGKRGLGADSKSVKGPSELGSNTVATWLWAQIGLIGSLTSLPLLTHFLSRPEYGLWTQLLAVSALASVADLGLTTVFVRRLSAERAEHEIEVLGASMRAYYLVATLGFTSVAAFVCFLPGGLISPFAHNTSHPVLTAVLVLIAMAENMFTCQYGIALLAQGQMARQQLYGAAPGIAGTVLGAVAAVLTSNILIVAVLYCLVESVFNGLAVIRIDLPGSPLFCRVGYVRLRSCLRTWPALIRESLSVLTVEASPQIALLLDAAILGRMRGAVAVAAYGAATKGADVLTRFFSPMCSTLFVAFCRTQKGAEDGALQCGSFLPWVVIVSGAGVITGAAAAGPALTARVFGSGYRGADVLVILLSAGVMERMSLRPYIALMQSINRLGGTAGGVISSLVCRAGLAIIFTSRFGAAGPAIASLSVAIFIEGPVLLWFLRIRLDAHGVQRVAVVQWVVASGVGGAALELYRARGELGTSGTEELIFVILFSLSGLGAFVMLREYFVKVRSLPN